MLNQFDILRNLFCKDGFDGCDNFKKNLSVYCNFSLYTCNYIYNFFLFEYR